MAVMKTLLFITLAAVVLRSSSGQQTLECRVKKCRPGEMCRLIRFNCGSSGTRCMSREICYRPITRESLRANTRPTTTPAPTTRRVLPRTFRRFNPATSARIPNRFGPSSSNLRLPAQRFSFIRDCKGLTCPDGKVCKMITTRCSSLPCSTFPRCVDIEPKTGTCPTVSVSRTSGSCVDACSKDYQCDGAQKCCVEGCRMACMDPQVTAPPQRSSAKVEGVCPNFPEVTLKDCTLECSQDSECNSGLKCCDYGCSKRCVPQFNASDPGQRPNNCPFHSVVPENDSCEVNCTVDNDCEGIDKCCLTGCSMTCQPALAIHPPTRNRPGYCPSQIPDATCRTNCTVDSSCRGEEQKCCSFDCGRVCVDAILPPPGATKVGECPGITRSILASRCTENCRFDNTCPDAQKCCQYGCVSVCRDVVVQQPKQNSVRQSNPTTVGPPEPRPLAPGERPGTCPKASLSAGRARCRSHCSKDIDCPGQMKCCMFGCGKRCLNVPRTGRQQSCSRGCTRSSCPSGHRCIVNGCNSKCVREGNGSEKSGSCPTISTSFVLKSCSSSCDSDAACPGTLKCCQNGPCKQCLLAVTPRSSSPTRIPTQCPDMPATSNMTSCEPTCASDESCQRGEVCCPYGCSTKCLAPKEEMPKLKPLYCPATPISVPNIACFRACTSDGDCSGNTKCCGNGCSTSCVIPKKTRPRTTRPGSCPAVTIHSPTTNCESTCSSDFACPEGEKCCFDGCRRTCLSALFTEDPKKPGFCPINNVQPITSYQDFRRRDCGIYCNSDFSCPGDTKCCKKGCKTSCVPIESSPPPVIKAGFCPASNTDSGTCQRSCNSDLNCPDDEKCCFQGGCEQKCTAATFQKPTPRQGLCPLVSPLPGSQCKAAVEFCNSDHACPDPLKCCFDGCTNRCLNPEPSIVSTKVGFCPSFSSDNSSSCLVQCSTDDSCPGEEKCCSTGCAVKCIPPMRSPPKDKAGFCPFIPLSLSTSCQQSCQLDDSCPGTMKCCQNGCSRRCYSPVALPPAISKAGYCPATVANPTCDTPCTSDGSCPDKQKCCKLDCGMSCVDAVAEAPDVKRGFCPFVHPNISTMCLHTCSSDYSCPGDSKCCSYGSCSMRCMSSERFPHPTTKSGDCPAARGAFGRPERVLCLSDYSCPGHQKCCRIGNNVQCNPPQQTFRPKPGVCPNIRNAPPVCRQRCTNDNQCFGDWKCCKAGCSSLCVAPALDDALATNEGFCPYVQVHVITPCLTNCTSDADCSSDAKCCEYGCGMRCLSSQPFAPGTVKSGRCPGPRAVNTLYNVPRGTFWFRTNERPSRETYGYRNCRNDGQCPATMKCCASSFGGTECRAPL